MNSKKNKVLISLLLLFVVTAAASARSLDFVETSEPLQQKKTENSYSRKNSKTGSYVEQRGMIRRGATKTLFIPKGQWMVGGQVGWNQWNSENLNYLILDNLNFDAHTFSVGPYLGYFFAKNMAVGARLSYKRNFFNIGGVGMNLGDNLSFELGNYGYLQHSYKSSLFLRSYIPIGESKIFGLFGEFQLNYTFSEGRSAVGTDETWVYENTHSVGVGLGGGLVVFLTDFAAAEVMLNVGDCDFKWGKQNIHNTEEGHYNSSGANFRLDLFSIKFGVTFYL